MKEPLVYIITLNWNRKEDTIKCISSILQISYKNYEIILVDNGSKDNSVEEISKKFNSIQIISNPINLGYAEGNNVGIREALKNNPDYILLLNNDTTVDKNFLSYLVEFGENKKTIGILGPKILYSYKKSVIWFAGGKIDYWRGPFISIGQLEEDSKKYNHIKEVDYINGCCMLIKKRVIDKIGLLNKDYFAYVEDVDFNMRAKKFGFKSFYIPTALIYHNVSSSTGGDENAMKEYYKARNEILFAKKNLGVFEQMKFYLEILPMKMYKCLVYLRIRKYKHIKYVIHGIYNGITNKLIIPR